MSRLVCVSNRVSLPDPKTGEIKAGGLAVGVKAAMECQGGGLWIGWSGELREDDELEAAKPRVPKIKAHGDITFLTIPYTKAEYKAFYKGASNKTLWPLMHELDAHLSYSEDDFDMYARMNKMYAKLIKSHITKDDVIWVHDYHLMPLGRELRKLGVQNRIGYFHHTPLAGKAFIESAVEDAGMKSQVLALMKDLFHYDLIGLQSYRDLENINALLSLQAKKPARFETLSAERFGRTTQIGVFPISIETDQLVALAKKHADKNEALCADKARHKIIMGAERLDYTKGIATRLEAYDRFLSHYSVFKGHVKYHQISPLTRSDIKEYAKTIEQTREAAQSINQKHSVEDWTPLAYSENFMPREELMAGFRCADVALVTPLMDGQNLVAKEFVAVQDPQDPGVLILSRTAGAAEELEPLGILCVDPQDPDDIADKLAIALQMPRYMRMEIHRKAVAHLSQYDINHWAEAFVKTLSTPAARSAGKPASVAASTNLGGGDYQAGA